MKRKVISLALVGVLLLSLLGYLNTQAKDTTQVFVSGNKYIELSETWKELYVAGLYDMYLTALKAINSEKYKILEEKTDDMTLEKITKIFDRYLEERPEILHRAASACFINAMDEFIYN